MINANTHPDEVPVAGTNHEVTRRPLPTMGFNRGRQSVRGFAVKQAIIRLKCETNMSTPEIAKAVGRSRQWVARVWRTAVREAEQAATDPDRKAELKAWLIHQVVMTITKAQNKVDDHAAYGALVLKGVEQLRILLGLGKEVDTTDKSTLQEIAKQVDIRSPLVLAKLGRISHIEPDPMGEAGASSGAHGRT